MILQSAAHTPAHAWVWTLLLVVSFLTLVVLWDIVVSNITVARLVLGPMSRLQPAWVSVPLTLSHPTAISMLAGIITTTPGTVSCLIDEQRKYILVHALNCNDPAPKDAVPERRASSTL